MKLLLAALMLGMPSLQGAVHAGVIEVITETDVKVESGGDMAYIHDNKEEEFPHLLQNFDPRIAIAYWDQATGILSIDFFTSSAQAIISIYKNGLLIEETICPINSGDVLDFDLSMYGSGEYQLVITGVGGSTLYGSFSR